MNEVMNKNNARPRPPDLNDLNNKIDLYIVDYPAKLAKKDFISFMGNPEDKDLEKPNMPIRKFDNWLRTGVRKYGCDGTVYRSKRVLNHRISILGKDCDRNTKENLRPVHDEHALPVNLRSKILYNKNKKEDLSFNEICEFIFLTQVTVCVTEKAALDQEGVCDNDSLSKPRKIGKRSIKWREDHPNIESNYRKGRPFNGPFQVSFINLDGNPISFDEIPVFSRYIGTDIEINRYDEEIDGFKSVNVHNYKMKDHFEYMRNMYPEVLEKIEGLN